MGRIAVASALSLAFCAYSGKAETRTGLTPNDYLNAYFAMFPTRATAAGRHDFDNQLEDFSPAKVSKWIELNRRARDTATQIIERTGIAYDDALDGRVLLAQTERELNALETLRRADRDPLYWSAVIGDATVFLLVRDDLPAEERKSHARARVRALPRFADQAREHFAQIDAGTVAPELCQIAADQVHAAATFYATGFVEAVGATAETQKETATAASSLNAFADVLDQLAKRAKGSARLGANYALTFRLDTGVQEPVSSVLAEAEADLIKARTEAARFGRGVWGALMHDQPAPSDDGSLLRKLFERISEDRDTTVEQALPGWRLNVDAINRFVHDKKIISMPDPLTLLIDISPPYFVGQSVGGVYPPGPYSPDAKTILFIPAPSAKASPPQREAFFRDFNQHFNKMIVPHELIPGHYVQFKNAAHQEHKIRSVFADGVYVEGWGTFCERLLLDEGWGGPMERLAHLKKQLENIARTIVDIRVHTKAMSREDVLRFVQGDALQGQQLAGNMWTRALTSAPQITTYYLGYRKLAQIYASERAKAGARFNLCHFTDGMMALGPVPLSEYDRQLTTDH